MPVTGTEGAPQLPQNLADATSWAVPHSGQKPIVSPLVVPALQLASSCFQRSEVCSAVLFFFAVEGFGCDRFLWPHESCEHQGHSRQEGQREIKATWACSLALTCLHIHPSVELLVCKDLLDSCVGGTASNSAGIVERRLLDGDSARQALAFWDTILTITAWELRFWVRMQPTHD